MHYPKTYALLLVMSLASFLGFFFGLAYPEIKRVEYVSTVCTIGFKTIVSRYCCYKNCDNTCSSSITLAPTCLDLVTRWNNLSPTDCASVFMTNNSQSITNYCPSDGPQANCDDGYHCCSECCSTCQSCTTSCNSKNSCSKSCSSYICNCYCCVFTNHQACQVKCPVCYSAVFQVQYPLWRQPIIMESNITHDYGQDLNGAQSELNAHTIDSTFHCFYDSNDPTKVITSINYSVGTWASIGISSFLIMIILMYGTAEIFNNINILERITYKIWILQCTLWIGIIFPVLFAFLLLVPLTDKRALLILILCFIAMGWPTLIANIMIYYRNKDRWSSYGLTILFFVAPIISCGISALYSLNSKVKYISMVLIILTVAIPVLYIVCAFIDWKKINKKYISNFYQKNMNENTITNCVEDINDLPPPYER